jgi:hypothetical protein
MSVEEIKVGSKSFIKWTEVRRVLWSYETSTIRRWQEAGWSFFKIEPKEGGLDDSIIHFAIVTPADASKPKTPDRDQPETEKSRCIIM